VVEANTEGTVNVLRGNGDGTFHDPVALRPGVFPGSVAVGDFRGDGIPDLAVTDFDHGNTVSVLLGNGDGTFRAPIRVGVGTGARSVLVGDFHGDGIPDPGVLSAGNTVSVFRGNGEGRLCMFGIQSVLDLLRTDHAGRYGQRLPAPRASACHEPRARARSSPDDDHRRAGW